MIENNSSKNPSDQNKPSLLSEDFAKAYPLDILLVEDNLINQKLATRILNKLGYVPDLANNGKEGVEMAKKKIYDLILMDIQMPEMDGLDATRFIRQYNDYQPIIIAVTANALPEDRVNCMDAGMNDYTTKPIILDTLMAKLRETAEKVAKTKP